MGLIIYCVVFTIALMIAVVVAKNPADNNNTASSDDSSTIVTSTSPAAPKTLATSPAAPATHKTSAVPTSAAPTTAEAAAAPVTTRATTRSTNTKAAAVVAAPVVHTTHMPNLCGAPQNPYGYNFCSGSYIYSPPSDICSYFRCIDNFGSGVGYMEECNDGTYSMSGGRRGACSYHGGEERPVLS